MRLTDFIKTAFGVVFGYDLDAAGEPLQTLLPPPSLSLDASQVTAFDEKRRRSGSPWTDDASVDDIECFDYPQPYFSLSGQVPSRMLAAWSARRSEVI